MKSVVLTLSLDFKFAEKIKVCKVIAPKNHFLHLFMSLTLVLLSMKNVVLTFSLDFLFAEKNFSFA